MADNTYGNILQGDEEKVQRSMELFNNQPIDQDLVSSPFDGGARPLDLIKPDDNTLQTTIKKTVSVTGPGTFFGKKQRTLTFCPLDDEGWWFDRTDLSGSLPFEVTINNVWTTVRNIVLSSGSPHNYMRMVEHIIALKAGLGVDNLVIKSDSGDPPLFNRSSMDLVEAIEEAGIVTIDRKATYYTVKEPVTVSGPSGNFLTFLPDEDGKKDLIIDCAVDFKSAIGKQRIRFPVTRDTFRHGAFARTNTTLGMMLYCKTIGMILADVRNLGYTTKNILVAGPRKYFNKPHMLHNGKSLEAVWHRATLDLIAILALIGRGRFCGKILSFKSGHTLDVQLITELYQRQLLCKV